jgi:hypothetical protein
MDFYWYHCYDDIAGIKIKLRGVPAAAVADTAAVNSHDDLGLEQRETYC